jgi:uncharacterized membrane protein YecN with MAPEG domain
MPTITPPVVTALTASVLLVLQTVLMFMAANLRRSSQNAIGGEAGAPELLRAVRRHGNLAENAAIFLVGLAVAEMLGGAPLWVKALAAIFVVSRLAHAIGLSQVNTVNALRIAGVIGTAFAAIALAVRLSVLAIGRL